MKPLLFVCCLVVLWTEQSANAQDRLDSLYEPQVFDGMPFRVMRPHGFDAKQSYPVIVSLHGAGGRGTGNRKQLKDWNRQLAEEDRRREFPCYVVAPQVTELWNSRHLTKIQSLIRTLPSADMDRIYIMGHSMGGHGTYIFIQIDTHYFAAAAPSAGSGKRSTEEFIDASKIRHIPIWAFHGDRDGVCPIEKDRKVLFEMTELKGNMKLTTWEGDSHGVSGQMILGANNGLTEYSSDACDKEPDFMSWLFSQSRNGSVRAQEATPDTRAEYLTSGEYSISQSWSQETNYRRPYYVQVPATDESELTGETRLPVFIFLHGNGGNAKEAMGGFIRSHRQIASRYIMVFAQGYRESWNIVSERSKANDLSFVEAIVLKLASFSNVKSNNFTIMGASNGSALVNQIAIESRLPNIRSYITGVSPLNVWQYDGTRFKAKGGDNNYRVAANPMTGKRLLNISGTDDRLVPYDGGLSRAIPAKSGKLGFVAAEESTFLWARHMGFKGKKLTEPTSSRGNVEIFSYLNGDVVHCKVNHEGHGATHAIPEKLLMQFLAGVLDGPGAGYEKK